MQGLGSERDRYIDTNVKARTSPRNVAKVARVPATSYNPRIGWTFHRECLWNERFDAPHVGVLQGRAVRKLLHICLRAESTDGLWARMRQPEAGLWLNIGSPKRKKNVYPKVLRCR